MSIYTVRIAILLCVALLVGASGCSDGGTKSGDEFVLTTGLTVKILPAEELGKDVFRKADKVVGFVNCGWGTDDVSHSLSQDEDDFFVQSEIDNAGLKQNNGNKEIYSNEVNCTPTTDEQVNKKLFLSIIWALNCDSTDSKACPKAGYLPLLEEKHEVKKDLWVPASSKTEGDISTNNSVPESSLVKDSTRRTFDNDTDGFTNFLEINIDTKLYNDNTNGSGGDAPLIGGLNNDENPELEVKYFIPKVEKTTFVSFDDIVQSTSFFAGDSPLFDAQSQFGLLSGTQMFSKCTDGCLEKLSWSGAHNGDHVIFQIRLPNEPAVAFIEKITVIAGEVKAEYENIPTDVTPIKYAEETEYKVLYDPDDDSRRTFTIAIELTDNNKLSESGLATIGIKYSQIDSTTATATEVFSSATASYDQRIKNAVIMP